MLKGRRGEALDLILDCQVDECFGMRIEMMMDRRMEERLIHLPQAMDSGRS
jgi:hypothetical protein